MVGPAPRDACLTILPPLTRRTTSKGSSSNSTKKSNTTRPAMDNITILPPSMVRKRSGDSKSTISTKSSNFSSVFRKRSLVTDKFLSNRAVEIAPSSDTDGDSIELVLSNRSMRRRKQTSFTYNSSSLRSNSLRRNSSSGTSSGTNSGTSSSDTTITEQPISLQRVASALSRNSQRSEQHKRKMMMKQKSRAPTHTSRSNKTAKVAAAAGTTPPETIQMLDGGRTARNKSFPTSNSQQNSENSILSDGSWSSDQQHDSNSASISGSSTSNSNSNSNSNSEQYTARTATKKYRAWDERQTSCLGHCQLYLPPARAILKKEMDLEDHAEFYFPHDEEDDILLNPREHDNISMSFDPMENVCSSTYGVNYDVNRNNTAQDVYVANRDLHEAIMVEEEDRQQYVEKKMETAPSTLRDIFRMGQSLSDMSDEMDGDGYFSHVASNKDNREDTLPVLMPSYSTVSSEEDTADEEEGELVIEQPPDATLRGGSITSESEMVKETDTHEQMAKSKSQNATDPSKEPRLSQGNDKEMQTGSSDFKTLELYLDSKQQNQEVQDSAEENSIVLDPKTHDDDHQFGVTGQVRQLQEQPHNAEARLDGVNSSIKLIQALSDTSSQTEGTEASQEMRELGLFLEIDGFIMSQLRQETRDRQEKRIQSIDSETSGSTNDVDYEFLKQIRRKRKQKKKKSGADPHITIFEATESGSLNGANQSILKQEHERNQKTTSILLSSSSKTEKSKKKARVSFAFEPRAPNETMATNDSIEFRLETYVGQWFREITGRSLTSVMNKREMAKAN